MNREDVSDELVATGYQAIYGDGWRHCDRDDRIVEKILAAVLPEHEKQVRKRALDDAVTVVAELQMKDADRLCDGGGHASGCAYGETDTCHGEEAHATHERVQAALRKLRGAR
jgi:hypothetical protein